MLKYTNKKWFDELIISLEWFSRFIYSVFGRSSDLYRAVISTVSPFFTYVFPDEYGNSIRSMYSVVYTAQVIAIQFMVPKISRIHFSRTLDMASV